MEHRDALEFARQLIAQHSEATGSDNWAVNYLKAQRERLLQDIAIVQQTNPLQGKVLDIGCAPFYTTIALKKLGFDITGVDIDPSRFAEILAATQLDCRKCNFETERLPFADDTFDTILFSEVFEHLRIDLISTTTEIKRVLKPGGKLLLSTPNLLSFNSLFRLFWKGETFSIYKAYEKIATLGHMGHVKEYTATDVRKFAVALGFRCERTIFRGEQKFKLGLGLLRWPIQRMFPQTRQWFMLVLVK